MSVGEWESETQKAPGYRGGLSFSSSKKTARGGAGLVRIGVASGKPRPGRASTSLTLGRSLRAALRRPPVSTKVLTCSRRGERGVTLEAGRAGGVRQRCHGGRRWRPDARGFRRRRPGTRLRRSGSWEPPRRRRLGNGNDGLRPVPHKSRLLNTTAGGWVCHHPMSRGKRRLSRGWFGHNEIWEPTHPLLLLQQEAAGVLLGIAPGAKEAARVGHPQGSRSGTGLGKTLKEARQRLPSWAVSQLSRRSCWSLAMTCVDHTFTFSDQLSPLGSPAPYKRCSNPSCCCCSMSNSLPGVGASGPGWAPGSPAAGRAKPAGGAHPRVRPQRALRGPARQQPNWLTAVRRGVQGGPSAEPTAANTESRSEWGPAGLAPGSAPRPGPGPGGAGASRVAAVPSPSAALPRASAAKARGSSRHSPGLVPAPGSLCRGSRGRTRPYPSPPPAPPCHWGTAGAGAAVPLSSKPRAAGRAALRVGTSQRAGGRARAPLPGAAEGHPPLPRPRGAARQQRVPSPPLGPGRSGPCGKGPVPATRAAATGQQAEAATPVAAAAPAAPSPAAGGARCEPPNKRRTGPQRRRAPLAGPHKPAASVHHRLDDARVSRGHPLGNAPLQGPAKHALHSVKTAPSQDTPPAVEGWTSPKPARSSLGAKGGSGGKGGGSRRSLPVVKRQTHASWPPPYPGAACSAPSVRASWGSSRARAGGVVSEGRGGPGLRVSSVSKAGPHAPSQTHRSRAKEREPGSGKQEIGA